MTGRDDGAAAVEFCLVLPFLLLLVFGIIDFGRAYHAQVTLTQGAREGVRSLALYGTKTDLDARLDPAAADSLVPGALTGDVTITDWAECTPGVDGDAELTLTHTFEFLTPLPGLSAVFGGSGWSDEVDMQGKGVMRCGG